MVVVRNPPPVCRRLSSFSRNTQVCLEFHGLEFGDKSLKGCARVKVNRRRRTIFQVELGCFQLQVPNANQLVDEMEPPFVEEAPTRGPELINIGEDQMDDVEPGDYNEK